MSSMPVVKRIRNQTLFAGSFYQRKMRLLFSCNQVFIQTKQENIEKHHHKFFFYSDKIKWIREESLANVAVVEMVDLPLADSEGAIEKQLKSGNGKNNSFLCGISIFLLNISQVSVNFSRKSL